MRASLRRAFFSGLSIRALQAEVNACGLVHR